MFADTIQQNIEDNISENTTEENENNTDENLNINDKVSTTLKAFPSAYGSAAGITGGRGFDVFRVYNLNESGAGSFVDAMRLVKLNGGGNIVFEVAGVINFTNIKLSLGELKNCTIAGQTAPAPGITITSRSKITGWPMDNVIIRHIRIRPQYGVGDAFEAVASKNIIYDHVSLSWGSDETLSSRHEGTNHTIQWCIIGEGKTGSIFGNSQKPSQNDAFDVHHSLYYNISHRQPNFSTSGYAQMINNVVHNWDTRLSRIDHDVKLNHIGNYYSMGKRTNPPGFYSTGVKDTVWAVNQINPVEGTEVYTSGNYIDKGWFTDLEADNSSGRMWRLFQSNVGKQVNEVPSKYFVNSRHVAPGIPIPTMDAIVAKDSVISHAGAHMFLDNNHFVVKQWDNIDNEYIEIMNSGEGAFEDYNNSPQTYTSEQRYINFHSNYGGIISQRPSNWDTDIDGMPDSWEIAKFNTLQRNGKEDLDGDGYTDFEEYLNLIDF